MGQADDDLLARLNALRPSPVTLSTNPSIDVELSRPTTAEDHLSDRLKRLRNGESVTSATQSDAVAASHGLSSSDHDIASSFAQWQHGDHEQTVEELLAELEGNEQTALDPDSHTDIQRLILEARSMLPPPSDQPVHPDQPSHASEEPNETKSDATDAHGEADNADDERDADEYVQKVLADLEIENRSSPSQPQPAQSSEDNTQDSELPSAPDNVVESPRPPTNEDSELEARFAKLGLDLPSTPEGKPVSKKAAKPSTPKSKLPTFTDEDIESWCVICNEDGELRCLGCDDDIYCQSCWREGHGDKPGQEAGHRAVQYVRKGGGLAAAD